MKIEIMKNVMILFMVIGCVGGAAEGWKKFRGMKGLVALVGVLIGSIGLVIGLGSGFEIGGGIGGFIGAFIGGGGGCWISMRIGTKIGDGIFFRKLRKR